MNYIKLKQGIMNKMIIIGLFPMLFGSFGCKKNADTIGSQLEQIEFKIITLNDNKNEVSSFDVGNEIILALKVTNNSGKELKLESYSLVCNLLQMEDFLFVNEKADNYETDSIFTPIGRPFHFPVNCLSINLPYYVQNVPKGETILIGASWTNNPDNKRLTIGKYFTNFILTLDVDGRSKIWKLRADFIVK
jgi:hypothetical protein